MSSNFEQNAFRLAVALAVVLHVCVVAALIFFSGASTETRFKPLAVMDFAYHDPEGGEPGGGESDEPSASPSPGPVEPAETASEPAETAPEPEEAAPEMVEQPEAITSSSEDAPPLPMPSAKEEDKPKPQLKPKAKSKPKAKPKESGGALKADEAKPGGGPGSGRGGIDGGGIGNPNALNAYASKIRSKLNRLKKYPPASASKKVGGTVTVNFTVNRQGAVISSRMIKSSGNAALDQEAMALLKRCSPFPVMPKELTQNALNLTVPINFKPPR